MVNWGAIGEALKGMPRAQQHFITKKTVGICGVGKWMKRWGKWEDDKCPRCGRPEPAEHVTLCRGQGADNTWSTAIDNLKCWIEKNQTDPFITEAIITGLSTWRDGDIQQRPRMTDVSSAFDIQSDIGWNLLLEGWIAYEREFLQSSHYALIGSRKSGRRWLIQVIKKLWLVSWDMWEHRNGVLHNSDNTQLQSQTQIANEKIRQLYSSAIQSLPPSLDRYLTALPMQEILTKTLTYKQTWIHTTIALLNQRFTEGRRAADLRCMRKRLARWLQNTR